MNITLYFSLSPSNPTLIRIETQANSLILLCFTLTQLRNSPFFFVAPHLSQFFRTLRTEHIPTKKSVSELCVLFLLLTYTRQI